MPQRGNTSPRTSSCVRPAVYSCRVGCVAAPVLTRANSGPTHRHPGATAHHRLRRQLALESQEWCGAAYRLGAPDHRPDGQVRTLCSAALDTPSPHDLSPRDRRAGCPRPGSRPERGGHQNGRAYRGRRPDPQRGPLRRGSVGGLGSVPGSATAARPGNVAGPRGAARAAVHQRCRRGDAGGGFAVGRSRLRRQRLRARAAAAAGATGTGALRARPRAATGPSGSEPPLRGAQAGRPSSSPPASSPLFPPPPFPPRPSLSMPTGTRACHCTCGMAASESTDQHPTSQDLRPCQETRPAPAQTPGTP